MSNDKVKTYTGVYLTFHVGNLGTVHVPDTVFTKVITPPCPVFKFLFLNTFSNLVTKKTYSFR